MAVSCQVLVQTRELRGQKVAGEQPWQVLIVRVLNGDSDKKENIM